MLWDVFDDYDCREYLGTVMADSWAEAQVLSCNMVGHVVCVMPCGERVADAPSAGYPGRP